MSVGRFADGEPPTVDRFQRLNLGLANCSNEMVKVEFVILRTGDRVKFATAAKAPVLLPLLIDLQVPSSNSCLAHAFACMRQSVS